MQIESLKIFCDVIRRNSFSKGAEENNVSQSMASQAVHKLEDDFNVALIDRTRRPWKITPEGEICYENSRDILNLYQKMQKKLHSAKENSNLTIRVATIYSAGLVYMRPILKEIENQYPGSKIKVEYFHPNEVYQEISNNGADIGIVSFSKPSHRDIAFELWFDEKMTVTVAPEHPFAKLKCITPTELEKSELINFDPNLEIRRGIGKFFKKHNLHIKTSLHFDNVESIKRATEIGHGFSILPLPCLEREIQAGSLVSIPFKDTVFTRPLYIIHRKAKKLLAGTEQIITLMREMHPNI